MPYQFFPGCRPHSQSFYELPAGPTEEDVVDALSVPPRKGKGPLVLTLLQGGLDASQEGERPQPTPQAGETPEKRSRAALEAPQGPSARSPRKKDRPKTPTPPPKAPKKSRQKPR